MRRAKGVVLAFAAQRESGDTAQLAQCGHAVTATGQDLVGVGLVAHVPHHAVVRGVEHIVQGHRQLDRPEVGAEVPTGLGHAVQHIGPQFLGQRLELAAGQGPQVRRCIHFLQQRVSVCGHRLIRGRRRRAWRTVCADLRHQSIGKIRRWQARTQCERPTTMWARALKACTFCRPLSARACKDCWYRDCA